jgi:taurine transport system substrate-binding protein
MLQGALAENDLSADDVTLVNLQPQPIVAAWATKQIDAAYIWAPILTELEAQGGKLIINDGEMAKMGYFAGDVGLVSNEFAEQHPEIVQAWVEQNLRAVDWFNANGPGAYDAMMAEYELKPEQFELVTLPPAVVYPTRKDQLADQWFGSGAKSMVEASVRIGEFLKSNKLITQAPTAEQLTAATDASFLENAQVPAAPQ